MKSIHLFYDGRNILGCTLNMMHTSTQLNSSLLKNGSRMAKRNTIIHLSQASYFLDKITSQMVNHYLAYNKPTSHHI